MSDLPSGAEASRRDLLPAPLLGSLLRLRASAAGASRPDPAQAAIRGPDEPPWVASQDESEPSAARSPAMAMARTSTERRSPGGPTP
ncbi:hypothetical protein FOHLNKBM_1191 [Methylobacterium longum]|nr:hypothetical protein FOHLNKBM_1191 [Methylobacterium longum]